MRRVVWLLVFLAGCMRGCNLPSCTSGGGSGRDPSCTSTEDCEDGERCHESICQSAESIRSSERCLHTQECKAYGACRPGLTRSFLGANSQPTCLAERTEDCAASEVCKTQGRCELLWTTGALRDGFCAATTAKACASSTRCATHDECVLDETQKVCTRAWTGCVEDKPIVGFEAAMDLGAPWHPGEIADAAVACQLEDAYKQTTSYVRVGKTCRRGPSLGAKTPMVFRTKLAPKDRIEVAIQADPMHGTSRDAGYVRAEYTGESVFTSGTELPRLTCTVVSAEAARANAAGMVTRIEKGFVRLANERASPDYLIAEPAEAGGIRRVMKEAVVWLGSDPQVAAMQASLEAGLVAWRKKLDAAIGQLTPSNTGPKGSTVQFQGVVCGDALKARTKKDEVGKDDCGVEIAVKAKEKMTVGAGISDLSWIKIARRGPDATVVETDVIDVHTQSKPAPVYALTLEAGEEAIALVVPRTFLPLTNARLVGSAGKTRLVLPLDR